MKTYKKVEGRRRKEETPGSTRGPIEKLPSASVKILERVVAAFGKLSRAEQRQFVNALYSDGGTTNPKLANPSKQSRGAYEPPATSGNLGLAELAPPKRRTSQRDVPTDEADYFRRRQGAGAKYAEAPDPSITPARVTLSVRMRNNPVRGLNFERFVAYLDQWRLGFFRMAGMAWDTMERRDYQIQIVRPKRLKSAARHGYDILIRDDVTPSQRELAQAQRTFLNQFYANLTATNAINPDEEGGFSLLVRQMMDAIGKYYAVHEIVWVISNDRPSAELRPGNSWAQQQGAQEPTVNGPQSKEGSQGSTESRPTEMGLTAKFIFCPIWWFEGTRGKLRFLPSEFQVYGNEMLPGDWLVTCGEGLMESCSVLYMMKAMLLKANLAFLDKFGQPGIHGETDAPKGSAEWNNLVEAVEQFGQEWATVTNRGAKISLLEAQAHGDVGYQALLEVFDRAITQLWRGSDLGTKSSQHAAGASLQEDESEILETDDCKMIEETLDAKVTRYALAWKFGPEAPQLAYLKLRTTPRRDLQTDIAVDTFLAGFTDKDGKGLLGAQNTLERYARPLPGPEEERLVNRQSLKAAGNPNLEENHPALFQNGNGQAAGLYPYNRLEKKD